MSYGISKQEMIRQRVGLPIKWANGEEEWLFCSNTLVIVALPSEEGEERQRVLVTDKEKGLQEREGKMVRVDYTDFAEDFYGGAQ
jgi:hypothetical protein